MSPAAAIADWRLVGEIHSGVTNLAATPAGTDDWHPADEHLVADARANGHCAKVFGFVPQETKPRRTEIVRNENVRGRPERLRPSRDGFRLVIATP
jgi:hypothetical protein